MSDLDQFELFDASALGQRPARSTARRRQLHRFYFGLRPPTELASAMRGTALSLSARRQRITPASNFHISMLGVGQFQAVPQDILSLALTAGSDVRGTCFELVLDRVQAFRSAGQRPIVLRCAEGAADIQALRAAIAMAMQRQGLPISLRPIVPHLTLWYDEIAVPERVLARPFRWLVRDFYLIHSTDAEPHQLPGCWSLAG